jgi:hypothetical protein
MLIVLYTIGFNIQGVDQYGNNMTTGGADFNVAITDSQNNLYPINEVYMGNGYYSFPFNLTLAGIASVSIGLGGISLPNRYSLLMCCIVF